MKKLLIILLCLPMVGLASFPVINNLKTYSVLNECDNIILKNGEEVYAKIFEITPEFIKYKKCDKLEGPLISIYKKDILMLRYADGTKDIFKNEIQSIDNGSAKAQSFGLLSVFFALISLFLLGIVFAPAALILGIIGLSKDKNKTSAIVGTIIGSVGLLIMLAASNVI